MMKNRETANKAVGRPHDHATDRQAHHPCFDASKIDDNRFAFDPRLGRVKRFIEQHYSEPLPLGTVAEIAGLEKSYFSRYFHQKIGVCYHDWLHWVRVNHAIQLMNSRDMPVTQIAFAVGYQDLRTFERAFEKCTGDCPNAMKKKVLQAKFQ